VRQPFAGGIPFGSGLLIGTQVILEGLRWQDFAETAENRFRKEPVFVESAGKVRARKLLDTLL
jgi:hypothetical protein